MAIGLISFFATLIVSFVLDAAVRPRRRWGRRFSGWLLHGLTTATIFGLFLGGSGNPAVSGLLTAAIVALLMLVSNAKYAMLGEPLLFSDLALVLWVFRHPRFYLTALSPQQRWILAIGAPLLPLALAILFVARWMPHVAGLGLAAAAGAGATLALRNMLVRGLTRSPDVEMDLTRFGLIATLLLYWARWRSTPDPEPCAASGSPLPDMPELIVIVQCESFADPTALTGDADCALPGLARARQHAWQWGNLHVSGFGAYTMRTEYGVLFGRSEAALGFRRFDPYLTAHGETSYALPSRLGVYGYRARFAHPHDMRFYGRDKLMPAAGFETLIGESSFPPVLPGDRYVADNVFGALIGDLIDETKDATLIYAVTMENHGPWIRDPKTGSRGGLAAYLHHLQNSDAMLDGLIDRLAETGKSALLVFFGDHRPSIPGVTKPGGARHTPYAMLRFREDGRLVTGAADPVDLTPAALHDMIMNCVRSA